MLKFLLLLTALLGLISYSFIVMTATPNDLKEYEYERYKRSNGGKQDCDQ